MNVKFSITNNSGSTNPFEYGESFSHAVFHHRTRFATLLQSHKERVGDYLEDNLGVRLELTRDLDDLVEAQNRVCESKNAYRASIGTIEDSGLRKMLGPDSDKFAPHIRKRLAVISTDR